MTLEIDKAIERSVDSLQRTYAVTIGFSLILAIQTLFTLTPNRPSATLADVIPALPAFVAFLFTLVPFYHGMNRHLDNCYLERPSTNVVRGALLFDFAAFFLEAALLVAIAWSIRLGLQSFFFLGALLFGDMLWGAISHLIHNRERKSSVLRWSAINVITLVLAVLVTTLKVWPESSRPLVLMVLAIARTVVDFWWCWDFYFPNRTGQDVLEPSSHSQ